MKYIPYHVHSIYSILDGVLELKAYVEWGVKNNMSALFLSDHGTLAGVYTFWELCVNAGIKPIIGIEFYSDDGKDRNNYHTLVVAKSQKGFKQIVELNNRATYENFYYKPRIKNEWLLKERLDVVVSTACIRNEIAQLVIKGNRDAALDLVEEYYSVYQDDFYLELQFNELEQQHSVNEFYLQVAAEWNISIVVGVDAHYIDKDDFEISDLMHEIRSLQTKKSVQFSCNELYLKSSANLFESIHKWGYNISRSEFVAAVKSSKEIADKCDISFDTSFKYPHVHLDENISPEQYFLTNCKRGLMKKYSDGKLDPKYHAYYVDRMNMEFNALKREKFVTMFVIICQQIKKCKERGICVGPGRGSVVGVFCAYLLGITALDPIKYNLLFERFCPLSEGARVSPPDIDIDFDDRDAALDVLRETYGDTNVLSASSFSYYKPRSTIIDLLRVAGVEPRIYYRYSKAFDDKLSLEENFENPILKEFKKKYSKQYKLLTRLCKKIRQLGTHAAAAIVLPKNETLPMVYNAGNYLTQYDGKTLEAHGYSKLDYLGLDYLAIIKMAAKMADIDFDLGHENVFDEAVYRSFSDANVAGIFQFDAPHTIEILKKIPVTCFDDLMNVTSIIRPGLDVDAFTRNYNDVSAIRHIKGTEHIFAATKGVLVYQEQVMRLCVDFAGFTLYEADKVRKIIAKKTGKLSEKKEQFMRGAVAKGHSIEDAVKLWDFVEQCGSYIFNKSHACAYSYISYNCMWFKCYYPAEYFAACLFVKIPKDDKFKFAKKFCREINKCGIELIYPDVNSHAETYVKDRKIFLGLNCIKGVGKSAFAIEKNGPYKTVEQFVTLPRSVVGKDILEILAKIGAFRSIETNWLTASLKIQDFVGKVNKRLDVKNKQPQLFEGGAKQKEKDFSDKEKRMYQIEYLGHSEFKTDYDKFSGLLYEKGIKNIGDFYGRSSVCGTVIDVEYKKTKKNDDYGVVMISDDSDELTFNVWNDDIDDYESLLNIGKRIVVKLEINSGFGRPSLAKGDGVKISDFELFLKKIK